MQQCDARAAFDVAIVGGGPAGLSAAIVLGRSRRRVIVFDHGKPRNDAAHSVHCYLGQDGIAPHGLRQRGRCEARVYGVEFCDVEVQTARCLSEAGRQSGRFELQTNDKSFISRTLLLATGVVDVLPEILNIREFYGRSVHHCPYCDGWEHRGQKLAAFGDGDKAATLALSLRTWSEHVTACSNGHALSVADRRKLERHGIEIRDQTVRGLAGKDGILEEVNFEDGAALRCDALFFNAEKFQHSALAMMLGCKQNEEGTVRTGNKHRTGINGLFLAGDADGEVQFAIVAAAEGAVAATAINKLLQEDDQNER
jgi:thioredoxin reductase